MSDDAGIEPRTVATLALMQSGALTTNVSDCDNAFLLVVQEWHMEYGRAKQAILAASPVGGHRKRILIQIFCFSFLTNLKINQK